MKKVTIGICGSVAIYNVCSLIFIPVMNEYMYKKPIIQENIKIKKNYNYEFIEPIEGNLVCGTNGIGKLENVEKIKKLIIKKLDT